MSKTEKESETHPNQKPHSRTKWLYVIALLFLFTTGIVIVSQKNSNRTPYNDLMSSLSNLLYSKPMASLTFTKDSFFNSLPSPQSSDESFDGPSDEPSDGKINSKDLQMAVLESCRSILNRSSDPSQKHVDASQWEPVCNKALLELKNPLSDEDFFAWIKANFDIAKEPVLGKSTGYFQPILKASRTKTDRFKYPIYKRPADLVLIEDLAIFTERAKGIRLAGRLHQSEAGTTLKPYDSRQKIESGSLENKGLEIAFVDDPIDLFFMHIQGSGSLEFPNGEKITVSYHGTNGHDYTSIGRILVKKGAIPLEFVSMESIKAWLRDHPNQAQTILDQNASFVFFKEQPQTYQTIGAQETELVPFVSVATDPHFHPLGSLLWIQSDHPKIRSRLVIAQDVGGAIKGNGRLDLYCGEGDIAGQIAGSLNESISVFVMEPKIKANLKSSANKPSIES